MADGGTKPTEAEARFENGAPALPAELLSRIISSLVPLVDANASTLPHPTGNDLDFTPALPSSTSSDLLSAAASSTLLHDIASRILYRSPLLRTLKSLNLLASTLTADAKKHTTPTSSEHNTTTDGNGNGNGDDHRDRDRDRRAAWIRSLHLPPGDGLLQPGDTLAHQTCYTDSLRTLFDHASRLDFVSLEHRQAGAALLEFLHPSTTCRPRQITLSNLSFSAPPFSTTRSLAPLSKLTHLHLIKIVPPPALISFLVGEQINADEQGNVPNSIQAGLSPRQTLECLRLSLLPPDSLVDFAAYIRWRKAWKEYEQLSAQQQAHHPAPRAPRGPARRFAVQEALYDLAVHASRLPRLRLLVLELSPLGPLASPIEEERENEPFASFLRTRGLPPMPMAGSMTMSLPDSVNTASKNRKLQPCDIRAQRSDAHTFFDAIQTSRSAAERITNSTTSTSGPPTLHIFTDTLQHADSDNNNNNDDHDHDAVNSETDQEDDVGVVSWATREELRTAERDKYWRLVQAGKSALVQLWKTSLQTSTPKPANTLPQIRIVAARPNGHDRREGFLDFYCQALNNLNVSSNSASVNNMTNNTESESKVDNVDNVDNVGCWADADVFDLVSNAPWLSFRSLGGYERGWYWTGELPRETSHPLTLIIPSQISAA